MTIEPSLPGELEAALAQRLEAAISERVAGRIWEQDESLWGGPGVPEIGDRLGWLRIGDQMRDQAGELKAFVEEVRSDGFTDAALLGMGGSSLGPEVIRRSFGENADGLRLHVLDSTDPGAVLDLERSLDLAKTLFIVSSKSGGTIETLSHMRYFLERCGGDGGRFVAVTDPGSPLVELATESGFRRVFENDPNIGGRYSVLSYFGLVPAALMGVDLDGLLAGAQEAEEACKAADGDSNPGMWLGVAMGELASRGRDKLTFVVEEPIGSFGLWVEQLIAESTGKEGKGVLPVADEPLGDPASYGDDRVFAYLRNAEAPDPELDQAMRALADAGHPAITLAVNGAADLGRIFFFAEFATAVAGWVLGINPFDQPNVQEAKDNTAKVLEAGDLPELEQGDPSELLDGAAPPNYVAIMGYVKPSAEFDAAITELRGKIRDRTKATTTFGYGPRFLHSTGQLHKGGPPNGLFLQLVHDGDEDAEIPEAGYGFRHLKNAQAAGDLQTLRDHDLPAVQVKLDGNPAVAVRRIF
jgi:transaldolase / glucose-6-phosphate isomerase